MPPARQLFAEERRVEVGAASIDRRQRPTETILALASQQQVAAVPAPSSVFSPFGEPLSARHFGLNSSGASIPLMRTRSCNSGPQRSVSPSTALHVSAATRTASNKHNETLILLMLHRTRF